MLIVALYFIARESVLHYKNWSHFTYINCLGVFLIDRGSICGGYTSCHAAGSKIRACHQKELLQSLNTGFHIIRAEYNFVFPSGMLNNWLFLVDARNL